MDCFECKVHDKCIAFQIFFDCLGEINTIFERCSASKAQEELVETLAKNCPHFQKT